MKNTIQVIGLDPSLRHFGIAFGELDLDSLEWSVNSVELVKTVKSKNKTVRTNSDDLERCRSLYQRIKEAEKTAQIAFVEMPVGSQSADAMKSYGACIALIASLDIPVIQLTPLAVKLKATGDKNATKQEMITWASSLFPSINWLRSGKRLINDNEHLADACGAINAGIHDDDFKALVAMLRRIRPAA